jgi:hypothetical protein
MATARILLEAAHAMLSELLFLNPFLHPLEPVMRDLRIARKRALSENHITPEDVDVCLRAAALVLTFAEQEGLAKRVLDVLEGRRP